MSIQINRLVKKHTAFDSLAAMVCAINYTPTLRTQSTKNETDKKELTQIADAYDATQALDGDKRRAFRD
jgi:hypothetical protein